jgi:hypothetical protein
MIQRIQTILLLLAGAAGFSQFAAPYLSTDAGNPAATLPVFADFVFNPLDNPGLLGLCILGGVVSLAAIFLYKNRPLQARLASGAAAASILLSALAGFVIFQIGEQMPSGGSVQYGIGLGLPLIALICNWLAARFIRKDEHLVRSADRLR